MSFRKQCGHFLPYYFFFFAVIPNGFGEKKTPETSSRGPVSRERQVVNIEGGPSGEFLYVTSRQAPRKNIQASFLFCLFEFGIADAGTLGIDRTSVYQVL
jgi:hypothetical protein